MNRDLVWHFMDVQTRLITPFCPHYAEFVWRELLKKDGFVVKDSIVLMRKLLNKQILGSKKPNKKGAPVTQLTEDKLERLRECASEKWQQALALHQLGCVLLERNEYGSAQYCIEAAIISEYKAVGWMYQKMSLYNDGKDKIADLDTATELDPILPFPYKYRVVSKVEEKQTTASIAEIDRIIGFKLAPDYPKILNEKRLNEKLWKVFSH
ncbi:hypothetical protein F3Y22_tig00110342pilonHSYRG00131 [Hibiscus syriacus]|uniref:Methionyl/Valyl/Leucyl/Isoleucyl-tRNA synthetase anticodon-binding domain-containing protein n=1 Tax=Hibiscus syriacus TaxID=106335 RepID=A0A6A3AZC7_HIBSY|nr:hypothetical protein F3Y22_tig00110342pilonHSYRG00131 [Hibiscus syriacus]